MGKERREGRGGKRKGRGCAMAVGGWTSLVVWNSLWLIYYVEIAAKICRERCEMLVI